jgi:outer membrane protein assembly factor BamA
MMEQMKSLFEKAISAIPIFLLLTCPAGGPLFAQEPALSSELPRSAEERLWEMYEGWTIESVSIVRPQEIDRALLERYFDIAPNEIFSVRKAKKGLDRVRKLPSIASAELRGVRGDREETVKLFLVVTEAKTRSILPMATRAVVNDWSFGIVYSDWNLRGLCEELTWDIYYGGAFLIDAGYSKPFFTAVPYLGIGINGSYHDYDYPYPDYRDLLVDPRIQRVQTDVPVTFNPHDLAYIRLSPGIEYFGVADSMVAGGGTGDIPDQPSGAVSTVEIGLGSRWLDRGFYPSLGYDIYLARKDWGVFMSDPAISTYRYSYTGTFYLDIYHTILMLHSRGGFNRGDVPLLLREHLGGIGSIRGLDFGVLDGDNSLLGSAEIRIPLNFEDITDIGNPLILADFHVFIDSGTCWTDPQTLTTELFYTGFGCGMNFLPAEKVMIRIDYAWRLNTSGMWQIDISTFF